MRPGEAHDLLGQFLDLQLRRIPQIDGPAIVALVQHQPDEAFHQIVDIAEGAGLIPAAIDGDVVARQGLGDRVGDHAPVVGAHARTISVEDARHARVATLGSEIIKRQRLGGAFAFIVAGAWTGGIHVAPIALLLGMHLWIAIDLAGGGEQETRRVSLSQGEKMMRAHDAGHQRVFRIGLVVWRRRGASEIEDIRQPASGSRQPRRRRVGDVRLDEVEARFAFEVPQILIAAGDEIIEPEHAPSARKQRIGQMRSDETRAPGD